MQTLTVLTVFIIETKCVVINLDLVKVPAGLVLSSFGNRVWTWKINQIFEGLNWCGICIVGIRLSRLFSDTVGVLTFELEAGCVRSWSRWWRRFSEGKVIVSRASQNAQPQGYQGVRVNHSWWNFSTHRYGYGTLHLSWATIKSLGVTLTEVKVVPNWSVVAVFVLWLMVEKSVHQEDPSQLRQRILHQKQ